MKWLRMGWKFSALLMAALVVPSSDAADRVVRVEGLTLAPGQTNSVRVVLESLGNEKALGFNLAYDPAVLRFVRALAGVDSLAVNAALYSNPNQTTNLGRLGVTLSLDLFSPDTFPTGTNIIADVFFTPAAGVTGGVSAITFTNEPVITEISDAMAGELSATYVGSSVSVVLHCGFSLGTNAASFLDVGGVGSVTLLASNEVCAWSLANTNPWINVTSTTNGAGSVTVEFLVGANPDLAARTGTMVIAGHDFTVAQQGITCTYALAPAGRTHGPAAETNSFNVLAADPCAWSVSNTNAWVTVLSGGSGPGNGTITYAVTDNFSASPRAGALLAGGQVFLITQQGVSCSFAFTPTNLVHGPAGGTGTVSVATGAGCGWDVTTTNGWIQFTSATNGTGHGSFDYSLLANWDPAARTGAVFVAGQTLPVTQAAYTGGFVFRSITANVSGEVSLSLSGGPLGQWELQISGDLSNWSRLADLTNATGRVDFVTPAAESNRFYRAVQP